MSQKKTNATEVHTYERAGVNIEEGNQFVTQIQSDVKSTHHAAVLHNPRGFAALFSLKQFQNLEDPILVSSTDGVGTKISLALQHNQLQGIGQDLAAMVLNDIAVTGARPMFFLDYIATSRLDLARMQVILKGLCQALKSCNTSLVGGETAEMPGVYQPQEIDLAGFAVGVVERKKQITAQRVLAQKHRLEEYRLIGIESSGFHSNGYSLIRHLALEKAWNLQETAAISSHQKPSAGAKLIDFLMTPTHLYVNFCVSLTEQLNEQELLGISHITGGGILENPNRMLPSQESDSSFEGVLHFDFSRYPLPSAFRWVGQQAGLTVTELLKTFNCGLGLVVLVHQSKTAFVQQLAQQAGYQSFDVGSVVGKKMSEKSIFSIQAKTDEVIVSGLEYNL